MGKVVTARITDVEMLAWLNDQDNISDTIRCALRGLMMRECGVTPSGDRDSTDRICKALEGIRIALEQMGAIVPSISPQSVEDPEAQKNFDRMLESWQSDSYT